MNRDRFQIRPYAPKDFHAVYEVCLQTGDAGSDATPLHTDPMALGNLYVGPYLTLEPDLAFVLEDDRGVCGYVLGALDSMSFFDACLRDWMPELRRQHPDPAGDPADWSPTQQVYHEFHHPDLFWPEPYDQFPSHLHIDLIPRAQGQGCGSELMRVELSALTRRGSPGVHLGMAVSNQRAEQFYRKLGFRELTRVKDSLYLGKPLL